MADRRVSAIVGLFSVMSCLALVVLVMIKHGCDMHHGGEVLLISKY